MRNMKTVTEEEMYSIDGGSGLEGFVKVVICIYKFLTNPIRLFPLRFCGNPVC